jgi:hypothetical protein
MLQAGTLTFTAFCKPHGAEPSDPSMRALVEITTSQDHAAVSTDNSKRVDLLTGVPFSFGRSGVSDDTMPAIDHLSFAATSPDRTIVTGVLSLGANLGNDKGKCLLGGHAVVSPGA